jgi:hypothetical protein
VSSRLPSAVFQPPSRRIPPRPAPHAFERAQRFAQVYLAARGRRIHGGAAVRIVRILNLSDISVFGKRYPSFSREAAPPVSLSRLPLSDAEPARPRLAATRKIGLGRARVKIIDGDSIECTVTIIPIECTVTVIRNPEHRRWFNLRTQANRRVRPGSRALVSRSRSLSRWRESSRRFS